MHSARKLALIVMVARSRAQLQFSLVLLGLALALFAHPAAAQFTAGVKRDYATGVAPQAQAFGDVNGDGRLDLVTVNTTANSVSVLLGLGGGVFGAKTDFTVGNGPAHLALADLNDDGRLDIATANTATTTITLLFGNGLGIFGGRTDMTSGTAPRFVLARDLNGDDRADLVVPNISGANMAVFLARPGGGFNARVDYATAVQPISAGAADINMDGHIDLVVSNASSSTLSFFPGDGRGGFGVRTDVPTGTSPRMLAVGDLNGDAIPDVVVPNFSTSSVSVYLGNGSGIGPRTDFTTAGSPLSVALGDATGDGIPDIVAASFTLGGVSLLPGLGGGTFGAKVDFVTGANARMADIIDLNGDGARDIITPNFGSNTVSVQLNGGTFASNLILPGGGTSISAVPGAKHVFVGDATGDGQADLVVTNPGATNGVTLLPGNGTSAFPNRVILSPGASLAETVVGDLDRDGIPDLLTSGVGQLYVQLGRGGGQFDSPVSFVAGSGPTGLVLADLNSNGALDLVVQNSTGSGISRFFGNGDGTFSSQLALATPANPTDIAGADVTGDGYLDIITANGVANSISVFPGNGLGGLGAPTAFALPGAPSQVVAGDLNDDGVADLAVIHSASATLSVFLASGGSLGARTDVALGGTPNSVALGQVDLDQTADLVFIGTGSNKLWMLPGDGNGGFGTRSEIPVNTLGNYVTLGDVNADGRPDVVSVNTSAGAASVHTQRSTVQVTMTATPSLLVAGSPLTLNATVALTAAGGAPPAGTVRFYDGLTEIASGAVVGGHASAFASIALAGRHSLSAVYSINDPWYGGISAPVSVRLVATAAPGLTSISDIKSDQGKQVRLKFSGSGFDYNGSTQAISDYYIYRKSTSAFNATGLTPSGAAAAMAPATTLAPAGAALSGWDFVTSLPATADGPYEIVAPTLADSNGTGIHRFTFMVRAATPSPGLYYDSAPDSGYSVDNLPPAPPAALAGAWTGTATALEWNDNSETDLWHYRVYRGASAGFTPGAGNLVASRATSDFSDAGSVGQFYKVSALDVNGNESGFTLLTPQATSGAGEGNRPLALALRAVPRERSGGRLLVSLSLPAAAPARLDLLDVRGRQLAAMDVSLFGAGEHEVDLGAGRALASGVYLVRLTQEGSARVARVVYTR